MRASGEACVSCHSQKYREMLEKWKRSFGSEVEGAKELAAEAEKAIEGAKGRVSPEKIEKALVLLKRGRETLKTVEFGNGVHNKKFAIILIDTSYADFEDLIDLLK